LLTDAAAQQRHAPPDLSEDTIEAQTVAGRLFLPADDAFITPTLVEDGVWEAEETELYSRMLRPGATFVDVGAHVGYFSCLAARLVGPRGLVVAFEPHPRNYELLLANLWRNGLTNAVAFPWAVTDVNGFAELRLRPGNSGGHRLYPEPAELEEVVPVRTVALDRVAALRPPLDAVKIDAQGADDLAVRGMAGLLAASPDATLLVEFWPHGIRLRGAEPRDVLAFYRDAGFRITAQPIGERAVQPQSDEEILDYCNGEGGRLHVNLELERS
jgi:FkbM family methyltransferase